MREYNKINSTIAKCSICILLVLSFLILYVNSKVEAVGRDAKETYRTCTVVLDKLSTVEASLYTYNDSITELSNRIQSIENHNANVQKFSVEAVEEDTIEYIDSSDKFDIGEDVPLPNMPTNVKLCTDYRFYNLLGTPHNRLQAKCWTDEYGCRRYNNDYCVGLGSYYTTDIGDRFEVELETGVIFTIILGDGKADCDTDITNRYTPCYNYDGKKAANVLEFIIDKMTVLNAMYQYGSLDYYEFFKGNIVRMTYLGRDNTEDWNLYE